MRLNNKKMRAFWRALVLALALCALLSSCSKTRVIKYEGGIYNDSKSDVSYVMVEACYTPVATGEKYAEIQLKHETIELFRVTGLDPKKWLASDDGILYKAEGVATPTLEEMEINRIDFCVVTSIIVQRFSVSDAEAINDLIEACGKTERILFHLNRAEKNNFKLMLASKANPELFYTVNYVEYTEDVHVYTELDGEDDTDSIVFYEGMTYEIYSEEDADGNLRWYADCNYGKNFIYNVYDRKYVPVFDLFDGFIEEE